MGIIVIFFIVAVTLASGFLFAVLTREATSHWKVLSDDIQYWYVMRLVISGAVFALMLWMCHMINSTIVVGWLS